MESYGVENQASTAKNWDLEKLAKKQCQTLPYLPTQRESYVFCLLPGTSSNFSSLCALESRDSQNKAVCLLIHLAPQQIFIVLLCARYCSGSWRFSNNQRNKALLTLCSLLYPSTWNSTRLILGFQYVGSWFELKWTICWWSPWTIYTLVGRC